jgi:hypothetical protein
MPRSDTVHDHANWVFIFAELCNFVASPKNALHLFILMETIRESLGE